jgi:hypothetical protein
LQAYNLDLEVAIDDLTWRKFKVLLTGLGPNSAVVAVQSSRSQGSGGRSSSSEKTIVIDMDRHPEQADAFFASMVGKRSKPN